MSEQAWMTGAALFGIPVVESPLLPMYPSPGQDGRRIVRHGLADVLAWLGEDVGPEPGVPTQALMVGGTLHASAAFVGRLRETATPADHPDGSGAGGASEGEGGK